MDLELIDYDVEGAAYKNGVVVDGAYLLATVKRRPTGVLGEKPGEAVRLRIDIASLDDKTRRRLFAAFGELESVVLDASTAHFIEQAASPNALDAKIGEAARAQKDLEATQKALAEKHAELAALDAEINARKAQ